MTRGVKKCKHSKKLFVECAVKIGIKCFNGAA